MIKNFDQLLEAAKSQKTMRLAVAAAHDPEVLGAVVKAAQLGLIEPILIGDQQKIAELCGEEHLEICGVEIIDEPELEAAAKVSVQMVREGKADFLMKGLIDTSILLKAVLNREYGLRTDSQLSHVMLYDAPAYHKLLFLTDGGMNIEPTLAEKATILRNALDAARTLGMETVKVACIAAKEKVNDKMPATVDARALQNMSREGDFGEGVIVEGPLAFDLAVSKEAAEIKGFESEIAGDADVLLVPNIEVGNGIGKALTYLANAESAGVIMGAKVPVVLVSRADTAEVKLYSIALGSIIAAGMNPTT
ncbi:bifunctional enoyl-CoA hydratase/phosphate acetyltransferase [Acidaminobacter hydrogenoformans]|uniref:Phosphate butyryltransferase n=1 Tax=Acidaminobacter hydrogenoformans DSM 2784 TaxID=1120920 RepID=A0A1G5RTV8_9FIRM|nr:bifunctional enoyl-CoA hydratase/phosphate acetyltransferase [Acidaminobacter hydrogenoformans]SCZ77542.1 phosphate butyryltransferase [Acidaminobacter hydrogenoformans DSM 2784]